MNTLLGDVNADRSVDSGDVSLVRQHTLQTIDLNNSETTSMQAATSIPAISQSSGNAR